jgi:chemotaxis protein CheX
MEVFASMVFIDIAPETVDSGEVDADLSSMIGLAGDLKGTLAIKCPADVAMAITGAMLGMEVSELAEDVKDAIGEIANMIAGGLKESLAGCGKKIELAIPTTAIGKSIRTSGLSTASLVQVPFRVPQGSFSVELRYVLG